MSPRSASSRSSVSCSTEVPNWLARSSPSSGSPAASNASSTVGSRATGSEVVLMKATPARGPPRRRPGPSPAGRSAPSRAAPLPRPAPPPPGRSRSRRPGPCVHGHAGRRQSQSSRGKLLGGRKIASVRSLPTFSVGGRERRHDVDVADPEPVDRRPADADQAAGLRGRAQCPAPAPTCCCRHRRPRPSPVRSWPGGSRHSRRGGAPGGVR